MKNELEDTVEFNKEFINKINYHINKDEIEQKIVERIIGAIKTTNEKLEEENE